jgi:hypothetical protein
MTALCPAVLELRTSSTRLSTPRSRLVLDRDHATIWIITSEPWGWACGFSGRSGWARAIRLSGAATPQVVRSNTWLGARAIEERRLHGSAPLMRAPVLCSVLAIGCSESGEARPLDGAAAPGLAGVFPVSSIDGAIAIDAARPSVSDATLSSPNLVLLGDLMAPTVGITEELFSPDHCAVAECLSGSGTRRLIRFATASANLGETDVRVGIPTEGSPLWEYHPCPDHWHYQSFAEYGLVTLDGADVVQGRKQSFCLRDELQVIDGSPSSGYTCTEQGISVGWADVYAAALDCQFIDVTGVTPGDYLLRIEVNPLRALPEASYDDNVVTIPITL